MTTNVTYQTRSFGRRRTPLAGSLDMVCNSHLYRNLDTSDANESQIDSITFPTGRGVIIQDSLSLGSVEYFTSVRLCPSVRTQNTHFARNTIATQCRYVIALVSSERELSPCSVPDEPSPILRFTVAEREELCIQPL